MKTFTSATRTYEDEQEEKKKVELPPKTESENRRPKLTIEEIRAILILETERHDEGKLEKDKRHILTKLSKKDLLTYDMLVDFIEED